MCNDPSHHHGTYAPSGTRKLKHQLDKVEGKMEIRLAIRADNTLEMVRVACTEPPRFFEAICKGRDATEIATIVQRICGVCPFPYGLAASKAAEEAFGYTISPQAIDLRKLALAANTFSSHVLHAVLLVLPRFLAVPSVIEINDVAPDVTKEMFTLYKLATDLASATGGRGVHATGIIPGGMSLAPSLSTLHDLLARLKDAHGLYDLMVDVYAKSAAPFTLDIPPPEREFIALFGTSSYPLYAVDEMIYSTKGGLMRNETFRTYKHEEINNETNSKLVYTPYGSYMVGALARLNVNGPRFMTDRARKDCRTLGLTFPCHDPFMNTAAQIVEGRIVLEDTVARIEKLLEEGLRKETPIIVPRAGSGFGIVEAPRGLMYQHHEYDETGLSVGADCIIPTGMNFAQMQADLEYYVPIFLARGWNDAKIMQYCDLLLAHYDPCNSCAVHVVRLKH